MLCRRSSMALRRTQKTRIRRCARIPLGPCGGGGGQSPWEVEGGCVEERRIPWGLTEVSGQCGAEAGHSWDREWKEQRAPSTHLHHKNKTWRCVGARDGEGDG